MQSIHANIHCSSANIIFLSFFILCSCTDLNEVNETNNSEENVFEYHLKTEVNAKGDSVVVIESGNPEHINVDHIELHPDSAKNGMYFLYLDNQLINELEFDNGNWESKSYDLKTHTLTMHNIYDNVTDKCQTRVFNQNNGLLITETINDSISYESWFYEYHTNEKIKSIRFSPGLSFGFAEFWDSTGILTAREIWLHKSICGRIEYFNEEGHLAKTLNYFTDAKSGSLDSTVVQNKERLNGWMEFNYYHGLLSLQYTQDSLTDLKIRIWRDRDGLLLEDTIEYNDTFPILSNFDGE